MWLSKFYSYYFDSKSLKHEEKGFEVVELINPIRIIVNAKQLFNYTDNEILNIIPFNYLMMQILEANRKPEETKKKNNKSIMDF